MRLRTIWLATALAVIGGCGWPVWQGLNVLRYETAESKPEAARPWVNVSGLAFAAREYALTPVDDSSDEKTIRKRSDDLAGILATRPLSSRVWLELAETRADADEAPAKILEALELSTVTGPNEGYMITQRGLFGIWQWEVLPPETQRRAIADLVARQIPDGKLAWLKTTLADKQDQARQEIRSALQSAGFSKSNLARIGM